MFRRRRKVKQQKVTQQDISLESIIGNAYALVQTFEFEGDRDSLETAMSLFHQALAQLPHDSKAARGVRTEIALCLDRRGRVFNAIADVDLAIQMLTDVLIETPATDGFRQRCEIEANLALGLRHRFEESHQRSDLDRALSIDERLAVQWAVDGVDRALLLNNLSKDLNLRFLLTSRISDLDRCIALQEEALGLIPTDHPQRYGYLNNLANGLIYRHTLREESTDLDQAIAALEEAVQLVSADSPDMPGCMSSLAFALSRRAERDGSEDDSGRGVQLLMDVLKIASPGTQLYNSSAAGVADAFVKRYPYTLDLALLDNAIQFTDYLLSVRPDDFIDPTVYWTRSEAFRYRADAQSSTQDYLSARESAQTACVLSIDRSPMNTLHSAQEWAAWAAGHKEWAEATEAYSWCLRAVRILFGRQDQRRNKEEWLRSANGLASDATYGFAKIGKLIEAVEASEQCRAMLLSEVLSLAEIDVIKLREVRLGLTDRYERALSTLQSLQRW